MGLRELGCSGIVPWLGSTSTVHRDLHGDSSQTTQGIEPKLGDVSKRVGVLGMVLNCYSLVSSPEQLKPPLAAPVKETEAGGATNADETRAATLGSLGHLVSWAYPTHPGSAPPVP